MQTDVPIKSLYGHIVSLAEKMPKKTALLSCDLEGKIFEGISFEELAKRVEAAAGYLFGLSLKRGDKVALAFRNSAELLILSWAAWSCGIVTVPMDTKRDTGEQYKYKINLNKAKLLIAQPGTLKDIDKSFFKGIKIKEFSGFPKNTRKKIAWESGLSHLALILFTSGTTAHPKGAKLSLENLIVNAQGIREWLRITEDDRFLVNLPLHHINSTTFCLSAILAGGSIAIPPAYSNSHFWQQLAKTRATLTSIVQSILLDQLSREGEYNAVKNEIKLNRIQIGSAPVVAQTVQEFMKKFRIKVYQGYGQTETALRVTGVPMGLPNKLYAQLVEENSIGSAMSWADLQITGDNGKILGENQEGELVVKGKAVMEGYVGNEPAFRNGYFLTGDVGFYKIRDGQKIFYLKGRKKELIIKGGINISPVAVENQMKKISRDIAQAYVIGIPEERYGEEVAAVICWKEGIDEESAKIRLKIKLISGTPFLSAYEMPRFITSIKPENLPVTSTGKVQRIILKKDVSLAQFESIYTILETGEYKFSILDSQSKFVAASHKLFNHCWQPLTVDAGKYRKDISKQFILTAINKQNHLAGQIALIRTDMEGKGLLKTKYAQLLKPEVSDPNGKAIVCVSICSADYRPKPIPTVKKIPSVAEVRKYILAGHDPVFRFHLKPKGGQSKGAELVGVIAKGRPEDKSSCGYNMLVKYPAPDDGVDVTDGAPISNQLIEVALVIAKDSGIKEVYAYSRPGGLAAYISKQKRKVK